MIMQWINKGNEFNELIEEMEGRSLYIYGAGNIGHKVYNFLPMLKDEIVGCIDKIDEKTIDKSVKHINVDDIDTYKKGFIIVAIGNEEEKLHVMDVMRKNECICIGYEDWENYAAYVYAFTNKSKVIAPLVSLQISEKCNLNCVGCLACTPYLKRQRFFGYESFKENVDALFEKIDLIQVLDICGGEPLLVEEDDLCEIFEYVYQKYRDKIYMLRTVINGTIVPSMRICKLWKEAGVTVLLDNYSKSLGMEKTHLDEITELFDTCGVMYQINTVDKWIDLGVTKNEPSSDEIAMKRYDKCKNYFRGVNNKRLYLCDYAFYADKADLIKAEDDEYISLIDTDRKVILEFLMGFSSRGFCNMCKVCNGGTKINNTFIEVAKQSERVRCEGK